MNSSSSESSKADFSDIVMQSWGTFKLYDPKVYSVDKVKFVENFGFLELLKRTFDPSKKDDFGKIDIPTIQYFWIIIFKNVLYVLDSRRKT